MTPKVISMPHDRRFLTLSLSLNAMFSVTLFSFALVSDQLFVTACTLLSHQKYYSVHDPSEAT